VTFCKRKRSLRREKEIGEMECELKDGVDNENVNKIEVDVNTTKNANIEKEKDEEKKG